MIFGPVGAKDGKAFFQACGGFGELAGEADVEQVEARSKLNDGSDHCGAFDFAVFATGLLFGPFHRSGGAVFPKVNAADEPVLGVLAGDELGFPQQHGIRYATVAAVKSEYCALV